jgi:hypothetical protein
MGMLESKKKTVIKTWSRSSVIIPDFVGQTIAVHNGNKFIPFTSQKTWLAISWENLLLPVFSEVMQVVKTKAKNKG